jgi:shikimate kinase
MVGTIVSTDTQMVSRRALVVELLGPAGAGKTTLLRALSQRHQGIVHDIPLRKLGHIPFLVRQMGVLLPTFLRYYRHSRWFTWRESRFMVYIPAWHQQLNQPATASNTITVLDHGPLFRLVTLREFGPKITTSPAYMRWWDDMFDRWATRMDIVIWLDAPDAVLARRIEERPSRHRVKGKPAEEMYEFLARYRAAYEQIVARLESGSGTRILQFDTNQVQLDRMVEHILSVFETESRVARPAFQTRHPERK